VAVRRAGDRLRVSVRLVRAGDGAELWAGSREGRADDVVAIEEELARAITGAVGSSLPAAPARRSRAISAEAHELLLKARYLAISADTAPAIIGYYQAALARDPGFAPAYVGMADTWLRLAVAGEVAPRSVMEKAREAVDRALAIDDGEAAAHFVKAMILWHYAWRWEEADLEFRRALALDPDSTKPRVHYADYLASMDRLPEALEQAGHLSALDPVPAGVRAVEASVYYVSRDYDRTIRHCEAILAADTGAWPLYYWLGRAYGSKGRYEEAIRALEKWRAVPKGRQGRGFGMLGAMYAYAGRRDDALALLEEVERRSLRTYVSPVSISGVYMALGETDRAFAWLDRAYAERDPALVNLRVEPSFDPLRGHARFQALVRRLGFP
jgi:tetratricopeptide (TPR) repeat protein